MKDMKDKIIKFKKDMEKLEQMIQTTAERLDDIKNNLQIETTMYSVPHVDALGPVCPSLIYHKIIGKTRTGALKKTKPQKKQYSSYDFDRSGKPIRVQNHEDVSYYFIEDNENRTWALPFDYNSNSPYIGGTYSYIMLYENTKIKEFTQLDDFGVHHEVYDYSDIKNGVINCKKYNYNKSYGENGTLYDNKIYLENDKVVKIEGFQYDTDRCKNVLEYIYENGKYKHLTCNKVYMKKDQSLKVEGRRWDAVSGKYVLEYIYEDGKYKYC